MTNDESQTQRRTDWLIVWTGAVALFTLLLVAATVISDFFIFQEWKTSLSNENKVEEQLRAVVGSQSGVVAPAKDKNGNNSVGISIQFQNFGGTRTAYFWAWSSIGYFKDGVPNNLDLSKPNIQIDTVKTVIGPNAGYALAPVGVTKEEMDAAATGKGILLLWGRAGYADIYSPKTEQPIQFCQKFTVTMAPKDPKNPNVLGGVNGYFIVASNYKNDCNSNK